MLFNTETTIKVGSSEVEYEKLLGIPFDKNFNFIKYIEKFCRGCLSCQRSQGNPLSGNFGPFLQ